MTLLPAPQLTSTTPLVPNRTSTLRVEPTRIGRLSPLSLLQNHEEHCATPHSHRANLTHLARSCCHHDQQLCYVLVSRDSSGTRSIPDGKMHRKNLRAQDGSQSPENTSRQDAYHDSRSRAAVQCCDSKVHPVRSHTCEFETRISITSSKELRQISMGSTSLVAMIFASPTTEEIT